MRIQLEGGPMHGQVLDVPEDQYEIVMCQVKSIDWLTMTATDMALSASEIVEQHRYTRNKWGEIDTDPDCAGILFVTERWVHQPLT